MPFLRVFVFEEPNAKYYNYTKLHYAADMSLFNHSNGEDGRDRLISSCPLHCRNVRQAGFADNVKAIYFHAVYEERSVY